MKTRFARKSMKALQAEQPTAREEEEEKTQ